MKRVGIMLLCILFITSGCVGKTPSDIENEADPEFVDANVIEVVPSMDEPIYIDFDIENEMAYSVVKIIYEQPSVGEPYVLHYNSHHALSTLLKTMVDKEADFSILTLETALKLHTFGAPYKLVGLLNYGPMLLVSNTNLETIEEIRGEEVHVYNSDLQYVSTVLSGNEIHPKDDVKLTVWTDLEAMTEAYKYKRINRVVLPAEYYEEGMGNFIDLNGLFKNMTSYEFGYPKGALVVRDSVAEIHPLLVERVEEAIIDNISWIESSKDEALSYAEQLEIKVYRPSVGYVNSSRVIDALNTYFEEMSLYGSEIVVPDEDFYHQ